MDYEWKHLHVKAAGKTIEEGLKEYPVLIPDWGEGYQQ